MRCLCWKLPIAAMLREQGELQEPYRWCIKLNPDACALMFKSSMLTSAEHLLCYNTPYATLKCTEEHSKKDWGSFLVSKIVHRMFRSSKQLWCRAKHTSDAECMLYKRCCWFTEFAKVFVILFLIKTNGNWCSALVLFNRMFLHLCWAVTWSPSERAYNISCCYNFHLLFHTSQTISMCKYHILICWEKPSQGKCQIGRTILPGVHV